MDWTMPPAKNDGPIEPASGTGASGGRWRRLGSKAALVGAGLLAGGVLTTAVTANASTGSAGPTAPSESGAGYGISPGSGYGGPGGSGGHGGPGGPSGPGRLSSTGTVTAVGASSVSIRDSAGKVTTYSVTSISDIDKNGEAELSDLKAGDAVRFSTDGTTIAILHAGDENLDRPQGAPGGHDESAGSGAPGSDYGG